MNIPYGKQEISEADIEAVIRTLQSEFLTQGPEIAKFESNFAAYIGSKYCVAVSNGTAALHLSALALNVQPGDKVITTPITFAASANCIRYCGGDVIFADIDPQTYLLDINKVRNILKGFPKGTIKGIIPVDFGGLPVDMELFRQLADEYNLWILEDSCHAPGGYFLDSKGKRQQCGNGIYAELAIFSFHPVKHIACGEGGMIATNDEILYKKLIQLRTHGITRDLNSFSNSLEFANGGQLSDSFPGWYMEMQDLGFNYRITDFQAALGTSQLARADKNLEKRREIAHNYDMAFSNNSHIKIQADKLDKDQLAGHAYHLYIIETEDRLGLYNYLRSNHIFAQVHYIPAHLMPYYRKLGWKEGDLPVSEEYYRKCLSLPMYPTLSSNEQDYVIRKVLEFFE